jgi:hypothetical protein
LLFLCNQCTVLGITAEPKYTVRYPDLLSFLRPGLYNEEFPVPSLPETWSVDDENQSDIKYNDEAQHGLLLGNQCDVEPLFEPSYSSTDPHLISQVDRIDLSVI